MDDLEDRVRALVDDQPLDDSFVSSWAAQELQFFDEDEGQVIAALDELVAQGVLGAVPAGDCHCGAEVHFPVALHKRPCPRCGDDVDADYLLYQRVGRQTEQARTPITVTPRRRPSHLAERVS